MTEKEPSFSGPSSNAEGPGDPATLQSLQEDIASMATVMQQFMNKFSQQGNINNKNRNSQQGPSSESNEDGVHPVSPNKYSDFDQQSSSDDEDRPHKRRRLNSTRDEGASTGDVDALLAPASNKTTTEGNSGDLLSKINDEIYGEDCVSAPVSDQLAGIIDKRWQTKMQSEKLKSLLSKYNRPENCEKLTVPRVNPQIWNNLAKQQKMSDVRMSHVQESIVKACTAITRSLDHLITNQNDSGKNDQRLLVEQLLEATALLGHSHYEMSLIRRQKLKSSIKKEYADLCSSSAPVTSLLFGDDLNKQLEDLKKGASLAIVSPRPTFSGSRPPYDNRNVKKSFLGRGQKFNTFRKKQQQYNAGHSRK